MDHPCKHSKGRKLTSAILFFMLFSGIQEGWADWESDANARIEQIRKRDVQITIVDSEDNPVPNIHLQIEQTRHRFAFGTCIKNSNLSNSNYANFLRNHFEWGVCENETKWPANEPSRDSVNYTEADNTYTWCTANGITMRGHTLFWEQVTYVQSWVQGLSYAAYPAASDLLSEVDERIDDAVSHFQGEFVHWDVDNEMLPSGSDYRFYDRLGDGGRVHMFQRAHTVDPDCLLFMNEYTGNSFGSYDGYTYRDRANSLISMGAQIHGLGIQGHINTPMDPQRYYDSVLTPLSSVGLPIWVTEFDTDATGGTAADDLEMFYRICFSHAGVDGILMWGFWNDAWRWDGIANTDGTPNEAGLRYEQILDEWTTSETGITNEDGQDSFRGFHGMYEITLIGTGGPSEVQQIEIEPGSGAMVFEFQTQLGPMDPNAIPPAAPTGLTHASADAAVYLAWDENTEDDLAGYHVYRSTTAGSGYERINAYLQRDPEYRDTSVSNGTTYYYVVCAADTQGNQSVSSNMTTATPAAQTPYPGPGAQAIPGRIEAEDYDLGGDGAAYYDTTSGNSGNAYRSENVDIETCGEGGYNVGWIATGEWLEYTVEAAFTGTYSVQMRVASQSAGGTLHLEVDGRNLTGPVSFTATGAFQTYKTITVSNLRLTAGRHILRLGMDSTYWNINWMEFTGQPWLYGDFTENGTVDTEDLPEFVGYWLTEGCGILDVDDDCRLGLAEFAEMARNWLE